MKKQITKKALTALKGSIKKWEKIVKGTGVDDGINNCPLCKIFWEVGCKDCPVSEKADKFTCCEKTPYTKWDGHHYTVHGTGFPLKIECKICERYAKQEVKFLKSLLPKKNAKTK